MRTFCLLLFILSLSVASLLAACRSPDRTLPSAEVDSSNAVSKDLQRHLADRARLDTFRTALQRTGLLQRLDQDGPYTVFAPTNEAFSNAPASFDTLYFGNSADSLRPLLRYHIAYGRYDQGRVPDSLRIGTMAGKPLLLLRDSTATGEVRVQGRAPVERVAAQNGLLYVMPALLRPPMDTTASS